MLTARTLHAMSQEFEKLAGSVPVQPKPLLVGEKLMARLIAGARKIGSPSAVKRPIESLLAPR